VSLKTCRQHVIATTKTTKVSTATVVVGEEGKGKGKVLCTIVTLSNRAMSVNEAS